MNVLIIKHVYEAAITEINYNSQEWLEDLFYQSFDSVEVLPLGLLNEYLEAVDDNPIEASQLLVPIRWGQFAQLKSKGLVNIQGPHKIKVINAYYDPTLGLDFKKTSEGIGSK